MSKRYPAGKRAGRAGPLALQAITAVAISRTTFAFIDDPEGPNLVVVFGLAAIIYLASVPFFLSGIWPALTRYRRAVVTVSIQLLVAAILYLAMR